MILDTKSMHSEQQGDQRTLVEQCAVLAMRRTLHCVATDFGDRRGNPGDQHSRSTSVSTSTRGEGVKNCKIHCIVLRRFKNFAPMARNVHSRFKSIAPGVRLRREHTRQVDPPLLRLPSRCLVCKLGLHRFFLAMRNARVSLKLEAAWLQPC